MWLVCARCGTRSTELVQRIHAESCGSLPYRPLQQYNADCAVTTVLANQVADRAQANPEDSFQFEKSFCPQERLDYLEIGRRISAMSVRC